MPSYQLTFTKQPEADKTVRIHTAQTDTDEGRGFIVRVSSFETGSWHWEIELKATGRTLPSYFGANSIHQAKADAQKWVSAHVTELCAADSARTLASLRVMAMSYGKQDSFLLDTGAQDIRGGKPSAPPECLDFLSAVAGGPVRPGDAGWIEPSFCDVSWAGILDMLGAVAPSSGPRYSVVSGNDYRRAVGAAHDADFYVVDSHTGQAVDVSSIRENAQRYCDTFNESHRRLESVRPSFVDVSHVTDCRLTQRLSSAVSNSV